ncbi:TonB-dependent siderophore receptor [Enterovirga rhinocerotis]|uniref:Iron complex outermembrane receptor protein n=1 Tax=Enterovirga rhinocerotis TaxID=1339210 RepID=A0A4R7BSU1_9HYPH|nr:TonB-dependent siderophore receptor [Enterovirga rhinocerotis]TDR87066.1 iron complex outermembrane receptor protein [Enterovirga rhinocerotis]
MPTALKASAAMGLLVLLSTTALAQQTGGTLPPVTVDPPAERRMAPRAVQPAARAESARRAAPRRARQTPVRAVAHPSAVPVSAPATAPVPVERANGPVAGIVATRSATGTKTDTPILETPQSISVIPRAQMDQQGVESVSQALRYSAGIAPEARPANNRYDSIFVRGFGGGGTSANYVNYWDGMRVLRGQNYLVPSIDPYSLERIEVLRGPASVLFGQVNVGGLVNMVSKRPTEVPVREVQLQTGSYGRIQTAFDLGGPIDEQGQFLYRVTGLFRDAGTQVSHTEEQRIMIAPSFTWRPNDTTKLTVYGHYQRDPETGFYGFLPALGTLYANKYGGRIPTKFFTGEPGFEGFHRNQAHLGYEIEHKPMDGVTLRQNLRFVDMDSKFRTVVAAGLQADQTTLNRRITYSREAARGLIVDNQAQFDFTTGPLQHKVLVGMDYLNVASHHNTGVASGNPINYLAPVYGQTTFGSLTAPRGQQDQRQLGIYAQDQIKFERLVITGGVRQDWAETRTFDFGNFSRTKSIEQATTGRVGAVYLFDNGLAPYANYATSFDPLVSGKTLEGTPLAPTTGEQYEVGLKYRPVGYNAFVQVSAYDLTQNNVASAIPGQPGLFTQIGQVRSRGIEFEARATVAKSLDLIASFATMDVEITRAGWRDATVGQRPIGAPAHTASGWAYYTVQDGWLDGLGFGGGVRYIGGTLGQNNPTVAPVIPGATTGVFKVPAYTLYDAAVSYDFGRKFPELKGLKLSVNATNLTDKTYVASCFASAQCVYGYRRAVLGTLSYRW